MDRDTVIHFLEGYIIDLENSPVCIFSNGFALYSYSKWAAKELLEFIRERDDISAESAIVLFIKKMDEYSCMNSAASYIFSIAHDTALDILDKLI